MADSHQFIFGVILMYGFIGMIYFISGGAIAGLTSTSMIFSTPPEPADDPLTGFFTTAAYLITSIFSLFTILFLTPFVNPDYWWIAPINWAIFGTTLYIYTKLIRGGG